MFESLPTFWKNTSDLLILLVVVIGAVAFFWSAWIKGVTKANVDTIVAYKNLLDALKLKIDRLEKENTLKDQRISLLQEQVDVLKELPLVSIDLKLKEIAKSAHDLKEITKSNHDLMEINRKMLER